MTEREFEAFVRENRRRLESAAVAFPCCREDAQDLVSQCLARLWTVRLRVYGDPYNFAFRMLFRLFLNMLRAKRKRVQACSIDDEIREGLTGADCIEGRAIDLFSMEDHLPAGLQDWEAAVLILDAHGYGSTDTDIHVKTFRSRLHRARRKARLLLLAGEAR